MAEHFLALQRSAGNAAVAQLLQRSADASGGDSRVLARDGWWSRARKRMEARAAEAAEAKKRAEAADKRSREALATANQALTETQLSELRSKTRTRIGLAYTAYVSACKDVRESIKAAAKQQAEMMAMVFEIATGLLAPGLAKGLAGLANTIPVGASATTYRAAMAALNTDVTKELFKSAAKVGGQIMKTNAVALAGETDTDAFVRGLERVTQQAFQAISDNLGEKTPAEVGVIAAMFDSSVANVDVYRAEIKRVVDKFKHEVEWIGWQQDQYEGGYLGPVELAYIDEGGAKRLGLVRYQSTIFGGDYWFWGWVSDEMKDVALQRARAKQRKIETIKRRDVKMVK
jgi:hypothetical protein